MPPAGLAAVAVGRLAVRLSWRPIEYRQAGGTYLIYHATAPDDPFTLVATTADKNVSHLDVALVRLYFVVSATPIPRVTSSCQQRA